MNVNTDKANYRKINDGSMNSSKYHKKDSVQGSIRAIFKQQTMREVNEYDTDSK